jgi:hypothetical protein
LYRPSHERLERSSSSGINSSVGNEEAAVRNFP